MHRIAQQTICRVTATVLAVGLALTGPAVAAGEFWLRLVDADHRLPLEFLEKDLEQPELHNVIHYRMPQSVYLDDKTIPFSHYDAAASAMMPVNKDLADLERDLGTTPIPGSTIPSDRATEVLSRTGPKAELACQLADGEHVLHPGALRFRIEKNALATGTSAFSNTGPSSISLNCYPVDINLPVVSRPSPIQLVVRSGALEVFQETFPASPAQALRLYLPPSTDGYAVQYGESGQVRFTLDEKGVHVLGTPALAGSLALDVRGFTIGVFEPTGKTIPVGDAQTEGPVVYIFTDRNRSVFLEGERVQISVRAFGPAKGPDEVGLVLTQAGPPLELARQPLARRGELAAAELELDTNRLRPGLYQVQARFGSLDSNLLPLQIVSAMPDTDLKLFGYNKWGSKSFDPKDLEAAVRNSLNLVVQGGNVVSPDTSPFSAWEGRGQPASEAKRVKETAKAAGLPELSERPSGHDAGAEFLLAHGIANVPVACGLILYFNVGPLWQEHADDRNQAIQQFGQEWRRFPNFLGMVHTTGDGPTPATMGTVWAAGAAAFDIIHGERMKKLREVFEFKVGKLAIDDSAVKAEFERISSQMQGAAGFGIGMDTSAKVEGAEAVKLEWNKWINDLYPACFREERRALAALMPDPIVNCSWTWGGGNGGGMWPETFYRSLDNVVTDIHGDYGIMPLTYSCGADTLTFGQKTRPWQSLDLLTERPFPNGLKLFLEALSRNPAGIGVLNTRGEVAGGWGDKKEASDGMSILMNLGRRFGNLFMGLERCDEIAVLGSFRQAALGGQSLAILYGAHFLATKAGYQVNVVSEDDCRRDPALLNRYKAVFLVSMTAALPAELTAALGAFQRQGGWIIADEASKIELPDVLRVKVIALNGANEVNFRAVYDAFAPLVSAFRETVGPKVKPFFTASAPHLHIVRSSDGDLEYWTLFNDTMLSKEEHSGGHFIQFLYKGMEADLTAPKAGVLYDAFRRQTVGTTAANGAMTWHADMRHLPGTVYLFADRPATALAVTVDKRVPVGSQCRLSVRVLDDKGRVFTGRVPVEVTLTDSTGAERYRVYRTTNQELAFKIAGNDPAGTWTWSATDQATGLSATGAITVTGTVTPPAVTALAELIYDGPAIFNALHNRAFDIPLYPEQLALKDTADALVAKLKAAGVKATVRIIWPSATRRYLMNWKQFTVEDQEVHDGVLAVDFVGFRVRGKNQFGTTKADVMKDAFYGQYTGSAELVYYRDTILLGRADVPDGPLLDLVIHRCRMLPRNPSASFPAPGDGLLGYAWAPFHYGHDAIVGYGRDAAGLEKAVASLVRLAEAKVSPTPSDVPRIGRSVPGTEPVDPGTRDVVTSTNRVSQSLLPATHDRKILEAQVDGTVVRLRQEDKLDLNGARFATIDLTTGAAKRFNAGLPQIRKAVLDIFARSRGDSWASPNIRRVSQGRIMPVGRGLALVDDKNALRWFYDPFPVSKTYDEAMYPRRCQQFLTSPDGQWVLATFYDLGAGGSYGPKYRIFNQGATVLLNAATGSEVCRYPGFLAGPAVLAEDGSRCLLVDDVDYQHGRGPWNPHGEMGLAGFDRTGKELYWQPVRNAQTLVASRDAKLAVLTYDDARRSVSLVNLDQRREYRLEYPRSDVGAAVAPDGNFAVVGYADGNVRKVAPDGKIVWEKRLPAPGVPAVQPDGGIVVCANDGNIYFPETDRPPLPFGPAPVEELAAKVEEIPPGLVAAGRAFWEELKDDLKPMPLRSPNFAGVGEFKGDHPVTVEVPPLGALDAVLLTFRYQLCDPADVLQVSFNTDGKRVVYLYPYSAQPRDAAVPLRPKKPGAIMLTFSAPAGVMVTDAKLSRLSLGNYSNAALASPQKHGGNTNSPRVMVPNVHGFIGDPRVEQVAHGFPKGKFPLPPDLTGQPVTDPFSYFDGDVLSGTALYPTVYPGKAAWDPPAARATLRSAQVIIEFPKPRTMHAVGIWEHPFDRPVTAFSLECADPPATGAPSAKGTVKDWKLVLERRDNVDYFHLHQFPRPIKARLWRYTVLETPSPVQRVAEIELYEPAIDSLENEMQGLPANAH